MVAISAGIMYILQAEEKKKEQIWNWILYKKEKELVQ